jgi:hypothetical protein
MRHHANRMNEDAKMKRRVRQRKKRPVRQRCAKSRTAPRSLSVYDGTEHVGRIKVDGAGHIFAYNCAGKKLGSFKSLPAAQAAFNACGGDPIDAGALR